MLTLEKARELLATTTTEEHLFLHAKNVMAAMGGFAEYFNEDRAKIPLSKTVFGYIALPYGEGFIAKENVVGTLAVCYALTNFIDTEELALVGSGNEVAAVMGITKVAALAYLMFNLFSPPCFAALGAMNSEMKSAKWLWGGIALQLGTGYTVAFLVYQIGTLITTGAPGAGFAGGLIAVLVMVAIVMALIAKTNKQFNAEYKLAK